LQKIQKSMEFYQFQFHIIIEGLQLFMYHIPRISTRTLLQVTIITKTLLRLLPFFPVYCENPMFNKVIGFSAYGLNCFKCTVHIVYCVGQQNNSIKRRHFAMIDQKPIRYCKILKCYLNLPNPFFPSFYQLMLE
jgi:hypothetical protein